MNLLTLETATDNCSCALYCDGEILQQEQLAPRRHAELILSMIDSLLGEADLRREQLDALAFSRGPGSFTGLRIACGVTQGIAFALNLPVLGISTLACLAQGALENFHKQRILAALDARMGEIYWGAYQADEHGLMRLQGEESVGEAEKVLLPEIGENWHGVGGGWDAYHWALIPRLDHRLQGWTPNVQPRARDLIPLALAAHQAGEAVLPEQALPVYLRNQVIQAAKR